MPHDKNGTELKPGDLVLIACKVLTVSPEANYCNLSVETVEGRKPDDRKEMITLNAAVVEKVSEADGFAAPIDVNGSPQAAAIGDGSLIDLGASLLKAFLRRRGLITGLLVAVALGMSGTASAAGKRCGNTASRGGPLRNLIGGIADRIHERREARQSAGGCQEQASATTGDSGPVIYYTLPVGGASCPGGVCPAPARR